MQVEKIVLYYDRCFFAVNNDYYIRTNKANKLMWMTAFCIFTRYIMTNISIFSFFTHLCSLSLSLSLFLIPYYLTGSQTILQNYLFSWKYINFPLSYFEQKQQIHNYQRRQKMSLTVENVSWSIMFSSAGKTITYRIMDTKHNLCEFIFGSYIYFGLNCSIVS